MTKVSEMCVIADDFLPPNLFEEIFRFCNSSDFKMVHAAKVQKVWRLHDGLPLHGDTYHFKTDCAAGSAALRTPTGTVLDRFIEAILHSLDLAEGVVGKPVQDWREMTLAPWVYPVGAGLSLHQDTGRTAAGQRYTGSYTFYANPEWNLHWGGWLLVFDEARRSVGGQPASGGARVVPPWLGDGVEEGLVRHASVATAILPAPNRMVFISPHAPHMITRVDQNAGHHARISLAGFFLRTGA